MLRERFFALHASVKMRSRELLVVTVFSPSQKSLSLMKPYEVLYLTLRFKFCK